MDIEIQGIPQSIRPQYYTRLRTAKADLSRYKKLFKDLSAQLARSSLLASPSPYSYSALTDTLYRPFLKSRIPCIVSDTRPTGLWPNIGRATWPKARSSIEHAIKFAFLLTCADNYDWTGIHRTVSKAKPSHASTRSFSDRLPGARW